MKRTPINRKTAIKRTNRKRKDKRWKRAYLSIERVKWVQSLPCCACGASPCQNAHVISKAAGGTWRDVVPLCHRCHATQHSEGIETFQAKRGLDLYAIAERLAMVGPQE